MKTVLIRTLSGVVYISLILGSILLGKIVFGIVMLFFVALCLIEFQILVRNIDIVINRLTLLLTGLLIYGTCTIGLMQIAYLRYLVFVIPLILIPFIVEVFRKDNHPGLNLSISLSGLIYIVLPFVVLNALAFPDMFKGHSDKQLAIGFFLIIWTNDTFAYLSGMFFGKHKFFERISPKKTWEGTFGGLLFGILAGYFLSVFFKDHSTIQWIGFSVVIIIFGTFGDLFESMLKRTVGIKDSGNIMPGHGGILDRFDSILMAAPVAFVYMFFVLN